MNFGEVISVRRDKKIYKDGDKIIKLFDENYSKSNILNEALNQARVEETGLNIPKIREVTVYDGKWAIVMDYVEGETLEKLISKYPEKTDEFLNTFIDIQLEIHSKKQLLLTKYADKLTMKILKSELDASTRYDLSMRVGDMPRHTSVLHGDYNPSNVVITKDGTPFILDWSHASQGNGTADTAKTYLIMNMDDKCELAEKYLSMYTDKIEKTPSQIKAWLPLISAAQLIKANAEDKAKLMKYINSDL